MNKKFTERLQNEYAALEAQAIDFETKAKQCRERMIAVQFALNVAEEVAHEAENSEPSGSPQVAPEYTDAAGEGRVVDVVATSSTGAKRRTRRNKAVANGTAQEV